MNNAYLWCSAHTPTQEQRFELESQGRLVILSEVNGELQAQLNNTPMDANELSLLAKDLMHYASRVVGADYIVQPGGSPAFQAILGMRQRFNMDFESEEYVSLMYAHSERVSEDIPQADGTVKKVSVFKHLGWINC